MAMEGEGGGGWSYSPKKEEEEKNQGGSSGGGYVPDSVRFAMEAGQRANDYFASGESQKYYEPYVKPAEEEEEHSWTPTDDGRGGGEEEHEYNPPADDGGGGSQPETIAEVNVPVVTPEETSEEKKERNGYRKAEEQTPVVYEGGGLRTAKDRMANINLKQELEEETSTSGLPADFWNWSAERQQAYLSNPDNMAAAISQANRQAEQARRDAAELRANRQHYLGAGPTEPGTMNWTTATGPVLPGQDNYGLGKPPHDYQAPYTYNPELSQAVAIDAMNANPY